jgi:hypothetical protein
MQIKNESLQKCFSIKAYKISKRMLCRKYDANAVSVRFKMCETK